jgi:hypothetical protein
MFFSAADSQQQKMPTQKQINKLKFNYVFIKSQFSDQGEVHELHSSKLFRPYEWHTLNRMRNETTKKKSFEKLFYCICGG